MNFPKGVITFLYITTLILALTTAYPSKENLKQVIRIHIPVKHHTHVHTKTVVKKVPLPVPIPVKESKKHHRDDYKRKHSEEMETEEDFEGYDYPKKKRRTRHPFV